MDLSQAAKVFGRLPPIGEPIRILSIDGGGIYGLTAALWLEQMCKNDESFMNGDDIYLFVGCSSGACNAMLLAMEKTPRDAILRGKLRDFWHDGGVFTNSNPLENWLGNKGHVGYYGMNDFMDQLKSYMGDTTLEELPQQVLISTYDWHGRETYPEMRRGHKEVYAHTDALGAWGKLLEQLMPSTFSRSFIESPPEPAERGLETFYEERRVTSNYRHWKPKFFSNMIDPTDDDYLIREIAYAAATPPGFRAIRSGLGDGASFSANPSTHAISTVLRACQLAAAQLWVAGRNGGKPPTDEQLVDQSIEHADLVGELLMRIRMLSIGDGTRQPYYSLRDSNRGLESWGKHASNIWHGNIYPPTHYALQASDEEATKVSSELLGFRYFRMNPPVMDLPTVSAAYYAKYPVIRAQIINNVKSGVQDTRSREAIKKAHEFLDSPFWDGSRDKAPAGRAAEMAAALKALGIEPGSHVTAKKKSNKNSKKV